jgi:hypothetical protein
MSEPNGTIVWLCIEFEWAIGRRLVDAERLIRWLLRIYASGVAGLDVAYDGPRRTLLTVLRLDARRLTRSGEQRITFWVSHFGGRVRRDRQLAGSEQAALAQTLHRCGVRALAVEPSGAARAVTAIATAAGLDAAEPSFARDRPTLALDIGGAGWDAVQWSDAEQTLSITAPVAPPIGDAIPLTFRADGMERLTVEWARVVAVRAAKDAKPGRPAGFTLRLDAAPRDLRRQLQRTGRSRAQAAGT